MTPTRPQARWGIALAGAIIVAWNVSLLPSDAADAAPPSLEASFEQTAGPFLNQNCVACHNENTAMSGVRLDQLDAALEDRHLRLWEVVKKRVVDESMPPEGAPQPTAAERQRMDAWIEHALDVARSRPVPKNGVVRRLTVAQYRNTLRDLLRLEDDITDTLPPDAVSKDGFVNNSATLELSPLLMEAYLEIADEALTRAIANPDARPSIQNFRVDLGAGINPEPLEEELILGANSLLLATPDYVVSEPAPRKPFAFEHKRMRTGYRFIEGYRGNATVRGWREFDSIYHSVFACMRGSRGYPKGQPYSAVPEGLLLRPAIPNDELFGQDGTYGPKANFKISLRELPDHGRFRVTVTAAKYDDGLLLDQDDAAQPRENTSGAVSLALGRDTSAELERGGIYQVDVYETARSEPSPLTDLSRLEEGIAGAWTLDGDEALELDDNASFVDSPFGRALSLNGEAYQPGAVVRQHDELNVSTADFTVTAWIRPEQRHSAGIVARGAGQRTHGWFLQMSDNKGSLRLETTGPNNETNGVVASPPGVLRAKAWQHVAAVVRRGAASTKLYVNGYAVARGTIEAADLDNPEIDLHIGQVPEQRPLRGQIDEVRLYRRALSEAELQALVQPGKHFIKPPPDRPQDVTLTLGSRQFSGTLLQPAFLAVRLEAGTLPVSAQGTGVKELDRIVLTPLDAGHDVASRFQAFEKRVPRLGVHLGLRRDCGSTLAPVGPPQPVPGTDLQRYVFEGAIRDFPSPDVEKDNVNYLAGVREIGVRSEYTDGRDIARLLVRSVEFEGPFYEQWPPKSHSSIFVEFDRKADSAAYARRIISDFASRAYRRPVSEAEESALLAVYQSSLEDSGKFRESIKDALQVALTSPQFLFLVERSETPEPEQLEGHELASKLSYFLWNAPPDRELLDLAANGRLRAQAGNQVARMVSDERFSRFVEEFASQWLSLDKFDVLEPDRERFPKLTRATRKQLRREPIELLQHLFRNNLPAKQLIVSDYIVANEVVASYYDLGDRSESGLKFVPIMHGRPELGGLLGQAAIMAGLSDGRESNPVKRGAWLARKIIAEPPDDPPPNVPDLNESTEGLPLRERLEQHRSMPGCIQCHLKIDPWGVALEQFDAGGQLKLEPVDARSMLPDSTEVSGIGDLKRYLSEDRIDQVAFSVLKHLVTYASGRDLAYNEVSYLKQDGLKLKHGGYGMQDMLRYVVTSTFFLEK
ncbi:MAG: DUF1592 domain-containing protein [Acidobacteriia bacterium]|nr:DUF1592 domain-containing protein [Terriglobia bacterium]MYG04722.1 DUF1592 domain-containing protein [Terriglobia bacterium]MYK11633.1 DUF1592 domain-containing protein [Terriglobia bacterium]